MVSNTPAALTSPGHFAWYPFQTGSTWKPKLTEYFSIPSFYVLNPDLVVTSCVAIVVANYATDFANWTILTRIPWLIYSQQHCFLLHKTVCILESSEPTISAREWLPLEWSTWTHPQHKSIQTLEQYFLLALTWHCTFYHSVHHIIQVKDKGYSFKVGYCWGAFRVWNNKIHKCQNICGVYHVSYIRVFCYNWYQCENIGCDKYIFLEASKYIPWTKSNWFNLASKA